MIKKAKRIKHKDMTHADKILLYKMMVSTVMKYVNDNLENGRFISPNSAFTALRDQVNDMEIIDEHE